MSEKLWNEAVADEKARVVSGCKDLRTFGIALSGDDEFPGDVLVVRVLGEYVLSVGPSGLVEAQDSDANYRSFSFGLLGSVEEGILLLDRLTEEEISTWPLS
jgi:hypothetical protein